MAYTLTLRSNQRQNSYEPDGSNRSHLNLSYLLFKLVQLLEPGLTREQYLNRGQLGDNDFDKIAHDCGIDVEALKNVPPSV